MNEPFPESYILSVPGTDQTEELPRGVMLERIARGEVTAQHWVWSAPDQDWKQVSDIPSLRLALPIRPAPFPPPAATFTPAASTLASHTAPLPDTEPAATEEPAAKKSLLGSLGLKKKSAPSSSAPAPAPVPAAVPASAGPAFSPPAPAPIAPIAFAPAPQPVKKRKKVKPRATSHEVHENEFSILGLLCGLLFFALFAVVAANYEFIDKPFDGNLAQTPFILVPAHAHLGAFFQRDNLIIHVLPSQDLKADNFADFLYTIAKSTPAPPFGWPPYQVVELTPLWRGEYAFQGSDWTALGKMDTSTTEQRKDFVLDHLDDASGQALVSRHLDGDAAKVARDKAWNDLLQSFHAGS